MIGSLVNRLACVTAACASLLAAMLIAPVTAHASAFTLQSTLQTILDNTSARVKGASFNFSDSKQFIELQLQAAIIRSGESGENIQVALLGVHGAAGTPGEAAIEDLRRQTTYAVANCPRVQHNQYWFGQCGDYAPTGIGGFGAGLPSGPGGFGGGGGADYHHP